MSQNPEFEETEDFPWEEEMPQRYDRGHFEVSGLPLVGETFDCGVRFLVINGDETVTPAASVAIGDLASIADYGQRVAAYRSRLADAISDPSTDSNCTASVSSGDVLVTVNDNVPEGSLPLALRSQASNMLAVGDDPNPDGVIVIGSVS